MGRGSYFVITGFKLGLFKSVINGKEACIAQLTRGQYVQDFTVIDYLYPLRQRNQKYIYMKLFDEDDLPKSKQIYYLGSRYYHGIIGDGINAMPTYSKFEVLKSNQDKDNFRTFYKFVLTDDYGSEGEIIDIPNINVEDFRFPPNDFEPSDHPDPWAPDRDNDETEEDDYTTLIARSQALLWSFVNSGYNV